MSFFYEYQNMRPGSGRCDELRREQINKGVDIAACESANRREMRTTVRGEERERENGDNKYMTETGYPPALLGITACSASESAGY